MSIAQFVNLYAEDLYFLTTRAGWKVTKIYNILLLNRTLLKEILQQQIQAEFNKKTENSDQDDPFYFSIYESHSRKLETEDLEAIKIQQSKPVDTIENKIKICEDIRKNKMIIEFNEHKSSSVKSIAVKSETNIKCTCRFMSGKLSMFAKLSLKSSIYLLVKLLHFPKKKKPQKNKKKQPIVASIYKKDDIEQIFCYQVLTDTDTTSIQFIIVSGLASSYPECDVRDIFFAIFSKTEIRQRFDKSDEFWRPFNVQAAQESTF